MSSDDAFDLLPARRDDGAVTEATARQQARAVYKKAGLSGRNDLAAFSLEDLWLPGERDTRRPRA